MKKDANGFVEPNFGKIIPAVVFGVITLFTVLGSFYTITDGTVGVVSTLGKFDDSVAKAITVQSKATASANQRVAASLTPLLVKQHTLEKWSGDYPKVMAGDTGMLLQVDGK